MHHNSFSTKMSLKSIKTALLQKIGQDNYNYLNIMKVNIEDLFPISIFPVHYKIETINKFHLGEGVFKLRSSAATVSKLEIVLVTQTTDALSNSRFMVKKGLVFLKASLFHMYLAVAYYRV